MSFTEDELQAFNSILEQRFRAHRQEMEQAIDQRLEGLQQQTDRQLAEFEQRIQRLLELWIAGEKERAGRAWGEQLDAQRDAIVRLLSQDSEQKSRQTELTIDRMLATRLQAIEQLMGQYTLSRPAESDATGPHQQLETIEVQTELPWEDLVAVMGKALDERLFSLNASFQRSVKDLEQYISVRLHTLRDELIRLQSARQPYSNSATGGGISVQEVLAGIEHLERVMESMQVAMTANHALLSNRLYHHQQLPLERAHPHAMGQAHIAPANGVGSLLAQAKERLGGGLEPEMPTQARASEDLAGE